MLVVVCEKLFSKFSQTTVSPSSIVKVAGEKWEPLTIELGDTVVWENLDDTSSHSTTSDLANSNPNYWNGLLVNSGDTFAHTFNSTGTFTYHD